MEYFVKRSPIRCLVFALLAFQLNGYWQQEVRYNIAVTLNDTDHTLTATEQLTYINHSPDTLSGIWMHLWPNGYRNDKTAFASERIKSRNTRFLNIDETRRGWIDLGDVKANNQSITWKSKGDSIDIAWFELPEALIPGDTVELDIPFSVTLPRLTSRMGHIGQHYEVTQWYPKPAVYDATGWHPIPYRNWGEFYSEWGDYTVAITLPENYVVGATGVIQTPSERAWQDSLAIFGNSLLDSMKIEVAEKVDENGPIKSVKKIHQDEPDTLKALKKAEDPKSSLTFKTIVYHQERVHDFAWFADKRFLVTHTTTRVDSNSAPIDLWNFVLPKNFKTYKTGLTVLKAAIDSCSTWFMPYPYEQCTVVDGDISAGGGMEYPMITVINAVPLPGIMDMTIFHEVAHNWFYGLAGFNERQYPWLDEGFTTYAERRYISAEKTDENEENSFINKYLLPYVNINLLYDAPLYGRILDNLDQPVNLPADQFAEGNYRGMIYDKPSAVALMLQARVGRQQMDQMWHAFFKEWAFKHPLPEDVRKVFQENLGGNLDWYFDDLIGSRHKMDYGISDVQKSRSGDGWETEFKVTNHGEMTAPVPVEIRGNGDERKVVWVDGVETSKQISIPTSFKPKSVIIDPDGETLDMNRVNDGSGIHLKFLISEGFLNRGHGYTIRWLPGIWWNPRDGVLPAFWLMHRKLDDPILQWRFNVQYGTETKSWYESLSATRRLSLANVTQSNVSARWMNNWYAPLAGIQSEFTWQDPAASHQIKLNAGILYQDIKTEALTSQFFDSRVWNSGKVVKLKFNLHQQKRQLDNTRGTDFGMIAGMVSVPKNQNGIGPDSVYSASIQSGGGSFFRWDASIYGERRFTEQLKLNWNLFSAFVLGEAPQQERIYLSSSVDPNLESPLLFTHTAYHWLSPDNGLYLDQPANIPGYGLGNSSNSMVSATSIIGTSFDIDFGMPLKFIVAGGVGKSSTSSDWQTVGSFTPYLTFNFLPVKLSFPVAWVEDGKVVGGLQFQVNFRQHFSFRLGN